MSEMNGSLVQALSARWNRRRAAQTLAAATGSLLLLRAAAIDISPPAFAQDTADDDSSGHGRGRGRGGDDNSNSGPGGGNDRDEDLVQIAEVPAGSVEIRIVSDDAGGFVPGGLTVDRGQSVSFVNAHDDEHTATGSGFDTAIIPPGGIATIVLEEAGSFAYACQIHPEMTGRIGVRGSDGTVPQQSAAPAPGDAVNVRIANLAFDPAEIAIQTGTTVAWTNDDTVPHTVTSLDGIFDSGIFDPGATFTWTFDRPDSFAYRCQLHPEMQGSVLAEGEALAVASPVAATADDAAPLQEPAATPADAAVSIVEFAFEPGTIEAPVGTTVVWTNDSLASHTVTGDFADSGILEPGQTFSHAFTDEGDFSYVCSLHLDMVGTVRVISGAVAASPRPAPAAGPEGIWLVELSPDDATLLGEQQALFTLHRDGTVDAHFAAAPGAETAETLLTSGQGEWVVQGGNVGFALVVLMNDQNQQFAGTATIDGLARLDKNGMALDGTFDFAVISADGQPHAQGTGKIRGEMVPLEP